MQIIMSGSWAMNMEVCRTQVWNILMYDATYINRYVWCDIYWVRIDNMYSDRLDLD